ncbi:hypothetical protein [Prochlorococcus marinus]|uniref:hypothetical protein n=1 Tax=Prochlorococcus marinus TaxID=1219 RepID=UPI001ADBE644|nr:hypothetical protein [Prochlorococcus marinus]MBO8217664.1 hypothetical protein [Prochlorococcus marinus XMU1405]MBW3040826.1 hypothetical protein [Prochlorococcus marinus str. MU1405]MBW3048285.1 hypothetical protein [Prochlorococcus marinus str. MU1406]
MHFFKSLNLSTKDRKNEIPSSFRVGEVVINNLNPLGGMFKKGVTKAGRISLSGNLNDGTKVKVYESFSSSQINLRKILGDKLEKEDTLFPPILASDENFIVEKWISGKRLSEIKPNILDKYSERLINFIKEIHYDSSFNEIAKAHRDSFCYLSDYLMMRLKPWQKWFPVENLINEWIKSDSETEKIIQTRISHPDLSLSNIILCPNENIYIVDNELIGAGKGWLLDERNSFFRDKVLSPKYEDPIKNFYNLSWKLRLVGSALDEGDFYRAKRMADLKRI